MSALDWFPFHWRDFDEATREMTNEEVGAYLRLLYYQWQYGSIPNDRIKAGRITSEALAESTWDTLRAKFKPAAHLPPDRIVNQRMEEERAKAEARYEAKSQGGRKGALRRWAKDGEEHAGTPNRIPSRCPIKTGSNADDAQQHVDSQSKNRTPIGPPNTTPSKTPNAQRGKSKKEDNFNGKTTSSKKASGSTKVRSARSRRAPSNMQIPDEILSWGREQFPNVDHETLAKWLRRELEKLKDHEFNTPRSDWTATFRNWLRRCVEIGNVPSGARTVDDERSRRGTLEMAALLKLERREGESWDGFTARVREANDRRIADLRRRPPEMPGRMKS